MAWSADEDLTPGHYAFTVTLDDIDRYEIECQVQSTLGDSDCYGTNHVVGEADYDVVVFIWNNDSNLDDPPGAFSLHASGPGDGPHGSDEVAPSSVVIDVTLDDAPLTVVEYALDETRRADRRCGTCDEPQRFSHTFE